MTEKEIPRKQRWWIRVNWSSPKLLSVEEFEVSDNIVDNFMIFYERDD